MLHKLRILSAYAADNAGAAGKWSTCDNVILFFLYYPCLLVDYTCSKANSGGGSGQE